MELMVQVKDGEVWAEDTGGDGLPVVLLHPGIGDARIWDPVLPFLGKGPRVIRYDARGFGRSPKPTASYTQAEDLRVVLDHFDVRRAVLVGSSMGGATAISGALNEPARVAGLVLLCPGVTGYPDLEVPEVTAKIAELATAGDMDGLVALALDIWGRSGTAPDTRAEAALRAAIPAWFTTYAHQVDDPPAFPRLAELSVPCTLAVGDDDQPEVIRCNEAISAAIPDCTLVRLPDCDHFPTLRAPETVARLVGEARGAVGTVVGHD
ncbi:alpha/beta fold hydrolase [Streptomyces sp. GESEQ-35]|uniref:alpha/beta fold hydrolase n=1 Tax=Streptomyces sp. GESEQ-35 TaxID=2812657 RepID=UPI001B343093|nr:alpha/beta hydrolase [Streptomyces sp. GESEQ-35]